MRILRESFSGLDRIFIHLRLYSAIRLHPAASQNHPSQAVHRSNKDGRITYCEADLFSAGPSSQSSNRHVWRSNGAFGDF